MFLESFQKIFQEKPDKKSAFAYHNHTELSSSFLPPPEAQKLAGAFQRKGGTAVEIESRKWF
jgi:hypothetical protein